MSEKVAKDWACEAVAGCHDPRDGGGACQYCIANAVAAAEERGRRRGLEERDELRDALTQLLVWADRVAPRVGVMMNDPNTGARDLARKILAPRDSGKEGQR